MFRDCKYIHSHAIYIGWDRTSSLTVYITNTLISIMKKFTRWFIQAFPRIAHTSQFLGQLMRQRSQSVHAWIILVPSTLHPACPKRHKRCGHITPISAIYWKETWARLARGSIYMNSTHTIWHSSLAKQRYYVQKITYWIFNRIYLG